MKTRHICGRKMNYAFYVLMAAKGEKKFWFDCKECLFVEDTDNVCMDGLVMKRRRYRRRQYLRKRDVLVQVPMTKKAFRRMLRKMYLRGINRGMRFELHGWYGTAIEGRVKK